MTDQTKDKLVELMEILKQRRDVLSVQMHLGKAEAILVNVETHCHSLN